MFKATVLSTLSVLTLTALPQAQDLSWFRQAKPAIAIGRGFGGPSGVPYPEYFRPPLTPTPATGAPESGDSFLEEVQNLYFPVPSICDPETFFHAYAPPEVLTPHPSQVLTVFLPVSNPSPSDRFPTIMHSPASVFAQGLYPPCEDPPCNPNLPPAGFLLRALQNGWAVVTVGTVGHNSWPTCDQLLECWLPGVGNAGEDPECSSQSSCWDPNLWYAPDNDPSSPWNDFNYFYSEKDFTWARQYVAKWADDLYIDNSRIVVSGTSTGAHLAAFVAYGPDRAWASTEIDPCGSGNGNQVEMDTRVAGAVLFEPVAWLGAASSVASPPFASGLAGAHWPKCVPDACGDTICPGTEYTEGIFGPDTIDEVCPTFLASNSTSTWIRENTPDVPTFIACGDGMTTGFARDGDTFPTDYDRDNASTPADDPLLDFPEAPPLYLHDAWHSMTIMQDLMSVNASFHGQRSALYLREDTNWEFIPNSLAPSIDSGADPSGPGDVPLVTGEYGCNCDGSTPDSCDDVVPPICLSLENEELAPIIINWLGVQFCGVEATTTFRNAGTNAASYSVTPPIMGATSDATVVPSMTGHSFATIVGYDDAVTLTLGGGQTLLVFGTEEIYNSGSFAGPVANISIPIPATASLSGKVMSTQAIHFGGATPFALSNAQDWVIGCE